MKQKSKESKQCSILPRPRKFNSEVCRTELLVQMRQDRLGNLFYYVSYNIDGAERYVTFERFESVLDFIHSNFES